MYETYYEILVRMRDEYFTLEKTSRKNLLLSRMATFANACGKDLVEFILEAVPKAEVGECQCLSEKQKAESEAIEKAKAAKKAEAKAKTTLLLQRPFVKATVNVNKVAVYECPHCDFTTDSPKALSGHMKRHSGKYQVAAG
jgi:C2H2-type zinc-finger domain